MRDQKLQQRRLQRAGVDQLNELAVMLLWSVNLKLEIVEILEPLLQTRVEAALQIIGNPLLQMQGAMIFVMNSMNVSAKKQPSQEKWRRFQEKGAYQ
jgi:hypothetical protein